MHAWGKICNNVDQTIIFSNNTRANYVRVGYYSKSQLYNVYINTSDLQFILKYHMLD